MMNREKGRNWFNRRKWKKIDIEGEWDITLFLSLLLIRDNGNGWSVRRKNMMSLVIDEERQDSFVLPPFYKSLLSNLPFLPPFPSLVTAFPLPLSSHISYTCSRFLPLLYLSHSFLVIQTYPSRARAPPLPPDIPAPPGTWCRRTWSLTPRTLSASYWTRLASARRRETNHLREGSWFSIVERTKNKGKEEMWEEGKLVLSS